MRSGCVPRDTPGTGETAAGYKSRTVACRPVVHDEVVCRARELFVVLVVVGLILGIGAGALLHGCEPAAVSSQDDTPEEPSPTERPRVARTGSDVAPEPPTPDGASSTEAPAPTTSPQPSASAHLSEIHVQVRHQDGTPAASVPVELRSIQRVLRPADRTLDVLQHTDDTGRTTFRGYHGHLMLSVGGDTTGAAHRELHTAAGSQTHERLELRPANRVHGRVLSAQAEEPEEVVVTLQAYDDAGSRIWATSGAVGREGVFDTGWVVPEAAVRLRIDAVVMWGTATGYGTVERELAVTDLPTTGLELAVRPPAQIRMRALNELGRPVEATVRSPQLPKLTTNGRSDGVATLSASLANPLRLIVKAAGHAPRWVRVEPTDADEVDLGDVVLSCGAAVAGRLVDEDGAPINAWWVHRETVLESGERYFLDRVQTDITGAFRFEHVADRDWELSTSWTQRFTHIAPRHRHGSVDPGGEPLEWVVPRPTWVEVVAAGAIEHTVRLEVAVRRKTADDTSGEEVVRRTLHRFRPTSLRIEVPGGGRYEVELTPLGCDPLTASFEVERAGHARVVLTR